MSNDRTHAIGNSVSVNIFPLVDVERAEIVVGAYYQERDNDEGDIFIGAQIDPGVGEDIIYRLVSITDGNRWDDRGTVPEDFIRLPEGRTITIEVGS